MLDMVLMYCLQLCAKIHGVTVMTNLSPAKYSLSRLICQGKALRDRSKENEANTGENYYNLGLPQNHFFWQMLSHHLYEYM